MEERIISNGWQNVDKHDLNILQGDLRDIKSLLLEILEELRAKTTK